MKTALISTAVLAALGAGSAAHADELARVVSATPVTQQVSVPQQVCNNQQVVTGYGTSGAGSLLGAVAGGAVGNAIGGGGGRAVATILGVVGGAALGNSIEQPRPYVQNVQNCNVQTSYENRTTGYHVVYEYAGRQYAVQMPGNPGEYVRVQVGPDGQPVSAAPWQQPVVASTSYVQPATTVYTAPAPVVYAPAPAYYAPSYYAPSYYGPSYYGGPPLGVSLNFGYTRFHGGGYYGGGRHWR